MEIERAGDVALLRMRGGKANAMSRALLEDLGAAVDSVGAGDARGLVITGYDTFFSGGLALPELIDLDRPAMRSFIDIFGTVMAKILRLDLPVVAAINGHAIAGGCVLALQCDARLMATGNGKIGLNEVQLGIGLPASILEPLRLRVPPSSYTPVALEGGLFSADEAARLGLVDAAVAPGELIERAVARAAALGRAPRTAYGQVKAALLRPTLEAMARHADAERERWLDTWFGGAGQTILRETVARLTRR
ncbi:MAG TPA: enoyl-CoA hydratase/isomerase family protein [Kofleriaceae bacterium]|nr:enoyl-CoA hydratase/isomerase family protein [Kofleriaceae bacterium]